MVSFLRSLRRHDFQFVRDACIIDERFLSGSPISFRSNMIRLVRRFEPGFSAMDDDVLSVCDRILTRAASDEFIFRYICTSDSDSLSFFRELGSSDNLISFRTLLQQLPPAQMRILILFSSSLLRFRFCRRPRDLCPLCGKVWLWSHFFSCRCLTIVPASDATYVLRSVKTLIRNGSWDELLHHVRFYLIQWRALVNDPCFSIDDLELLRVPDVSES